ncbi:CCC motif membrane protein [Chryseobacterium sp. MMS23-Vi53]|uniref:CCC motif membrane protein n=1 Tax=Chryseobacterium sp. MMS23-Vi53 TaxID=3386644 RepID=UPI0039E87231
MEQKLPNAQTVLILGIISVVGTCCCTGLIGIICGLIGLSKYKKDKLLYDANPGGYSDFNNLNTGRILCIIGLCLGGLQILYFIFMLATVGWSGYMEQMQELSKMGRG